MSKEIKDVKERKDYEDTKYREELEKKKAQIRAVKNEELKGCLDIPVHLLDPNMRYYWATDVDGGRNIERYRRMGFVFADKSEIDRAIIGDQTATSVNSGGANVCKVVGGTGNFLMKIPKELGDCIDEENNLRALSKVQGLLKPDGKFPNSCQATASLTMQMVNKLN